MRGRDLFLLTKPILIAFSYVLYIFPNFFLVFVWGWLDFFPGVLGNAIRYSFAKRLAKSIGDNVYIGRSVEIRNWKKLTIGHNVSIHKDCYIDAVGEVFIGDDVSIAHACSLISFEHEWNDPLLPIRSNPLLLSPIYISSDVWIGCGARILAGVSLGSRCVVAAGAVVTKSFSGQQVIAGVPAKAIKVI